MTFNKYTIVKIITSLIFALIFTYNINNLSPMWSLTFFVKYAIYLVLFFIALKEPLRKNKWYLITSILFSLLTTLGKQINSTGVTNFLNTILWTIALTPCYYVFVNGLNLLKKISVPKFKLSEKFTTNNFRMAIILLCWTPYLLAFFPGILYIDTAYGISHIGSGFLNFHDSIIYTVPVMFLYALFGLIDSSYTLSISVLTIINMFVLAFIFSLCIEKIKKYISSNAIMFITLFVALMPVFPLWAVCICKDGIYNALFLYVVIETFVSYKENDFSKKKCVKLFFILLIMCLLRNNTVYILILYLVFMFFLKGAKEYKLTLLVAILSFVLVKFSLTNFFNVATDGIRESLSVPLQQISRVYNYSDYFSDDEKELLGNLSSFNNWDYYCPTIADTAKHQIIEKNINTDFWKLYIKTGVDNLNTYVDAFVGLTSPSYYPDLIIKPYSNETFARFEMDRNLKKVEEFDSSHIAKLHNYFDTDTYSGISLPLLPTFRKIMVDFSWKIGFEYVPVVSKIFSISSYTFVYLMFYTYALANKNKEQVIAFMPAIFLWLTFLFGPCVLLRYYLLFFFMLPFELILFKQK